MRHTKSISALTLAALLSVVSYASRAQGTDDQRTACYNDAFRLCSAHIPDERAIEACLEANRPNLSPACQVQFDPPAPKSRSRR